jgi:hypothetical protein
MLKLTAATCLLAFALFTITSCEKEDEAKKTFRYEKTGIAMTGAQENPAVATAATGTLDVVYLKTTKILSYTVTWTGLTGPVAAMHIHGNAPVGFNAGILQNIVTPSNGLYPTLTSGQPTFGASGKLSGTLLVDGAAIKEQDLLNGLYYLNIHTNLAGFPPGFAGGEIRGQIVFQ